MSCRINLIKERHEELEDEYQDTTEEVGGEGDLGGDCDGLHSGDCVSADIPVDPSYLRGAKDVVLSGPLGDAKGHGRHFNTEVEALHWAMDKYGENQVSLVKGPEGAKRWAVLVKNLRR